MYYSQVKLRIFTAIMPSRKWTLKYAHMEYWIKFRTLFLIKIRPEKANIFFPDIN